VLIAPKHFQLVESFLFAKLARPLDQCFDILAGYAFFAGAVPDMLHILCKYGALLCDSRFRFSFNECYRITNELAGSAQK